jgi:hypothetical protein
LTSEPLFNFAHTLIIFSDFNGIRIVPTPLGSRRTSGLEDGRFGAHSREMSEIPKFHSKMIKGGRWAVAITTGHGPVSYVGNFTTEAEAQDWISTNAKDWPQPADKPR